MCSWLFIQWGGGSIIATTKIVSKKPLSLFFFFPNRLVAAAATAAAEIEELSYVKKHLDVYDLRMSVLIVCLEAYTILATMKSLME